MEKAEEELQGIHALVQHSTADWLVDFHCQQVAEKALKAVLIGKKVDSGRIHDLVRLTRLLKDADVDVPSWLREVEDLNPFAVELRYETLRASVDFEADYAEKLAQRVYVWARSELGLSPDEYGAYDPEVRQPDRQVPEPPTQDLNSEGDTLF